MGQVAGQPGKDLAIYRAYVDGARQADLGDQYGVSRQAIGQAIGRVLDAYPEPDKAQEVRRTLDLLDDLVAVYVPKAKAGNTACNREVRGLLQLKRKYLGLDRNQTVEHTGSIDVEHHADPAVPYDVLIEEYRRAGLLRPRAELTRMDGPAE